MGLTPTLTMAGHDPAMVTNFIRSVRAAEGA